MTAVIDTSSTSARITTHSHKHSMITPHRNRDGYSLSGIAMCRSRASWPSIRKFAPEPRVGKGNSGCRGRCVVGEGRHVQTLAYGQPSGALRDGRGKAWRDAARLAGIEQQTVEQGGERGGRGVDQ